MKFRNQNSIVLLMLAASTVFSQHVLAVGNGVTFGGNEIQVPGADPHVFQADSLDFSYRACSDVVPAGANGIQELNERGYFWISSFQNNNTVQDSQINYYDNNGYHIYGVYEYKSDLVAVGLSVLGNRRGYQMTAATLSLYLDPNKDTNIALQNCQYIYNNTADDVLIGSGNQIFNGEKSEKDGLANGDFQFELNDWVWNNPVPIVPFTPMSHVIFNANLTRLGGNNVDQDHQPNGSGNIYWRND